MRVTFIGHASILIETRGLRILSDPWWKGPCFGAQWWIYPAPHLQAVLERPVDYVYISHGHHDHFHPPTLRTLDRTTKILVAASLDLLEPIRALGFEVIAVDEHEELGLGNGVRCRILPTCNDDTLMAVSDDTEACININDALHSAPVAVQRRCAEALRRLYGRPDYVFCGYGVASHFPNCYVIPGKDPERTAARRQSHFNRAWAGVVAALSPRLAFPFAADVVFLENALRWSNEPVHNSERPTGAFRSLYPGSLTTVIDIAPGFTVEEGRIVVNQTRRPLSNADVIHLYSDVVERVNRHGTAEPSRVDRVVALLGEKVAACRPYLESFEGDYRCLIAFRGCQEAIEVTKAGGKITVAGARPDAREQYDLVYATRLPYVEQSLTTHYGHEVLFVGSGGIFEYRSAAAARAAIHRELGVLLRPVDARGARPRPRRGRGSLGRVKDVVKTLIGRHEVDLYDLEQWTVYREASSPSPAAEGWSRTVARVPSSAESTDG